MGMHWKIKKFTCPCTVTCAMQRRLSYLICVFVLQELIIYDGQLSLHAVSAQNIAIFCLFSSSENYYAAREINGNYLN